MLAGLFCVVGFVRPPGMTLYTFRTDAPSFMPVVAPRMGESDDDSRGAHGLETGGLRQVAPCRTDLTVDQLEAQISAATGPENKMRRYRLRQRLKKLQTSEVATSHAPAKAVLPAALLPVPAAGATATPAQRRRSPDRRRSPSRRRSPERGSIPNIEWRAVSMEELRAHPSFVALPQAELVVPATAADLRLFRQDSRQWWACHAGRISTSACASCLGVYESRSASWLGVPPSLRGRSKALDAHARLASPVLTPAECALLQEQEWAVGGGRDPSAERGGGLAQHSWRPHRDLSTQVGMACLDMA